MDQRVAFAHATGHGRTSPVGTELRPKEMNRLYKQQALVYYSICVTKHLQWPTVVGHKPESGGHQTCHVCLLSFLLAHNQLDFSCNLVNHANIPAKATTQPFGAILSWAHHLYMLQPMQECSGMSYVDQREIDSFNLCDHRRHCLARSRGVSIEQESSQAKNLLPPTNKGQPPHRTTSPTRISLKLLTNSKEEPR